MIHSEAQMLHRGIYFSRTLTNFTMISNFNPIMVFTVSLLDLLLSLPIFVAMATIFYANKEQK